MRLIAALTLAVALVHAQQATTPLSLDAAQARALVGNPTIAAARLRRPVDVAAIGVARERPNPDVTFEAAKDTPRQSIGFSLPIELGGKRQRRVELASASAASGDAEIDRVIAEVRNDVRRAYFGAVAADAFVALADETRQLAVRARDAARARADAGDVARSDVAQAELALAGADDEVTAARGDALAARAELNTRLGQPASTDLVLSDGLTGGNVPAYDAAMADANRVNTELVVLDRRIAEQAARRDLAKALQVPDVSAGAGLTYDAQPDFSVGWRVNVGVALPLFTRHRAGVELEDAELAHLRAERAAALSQIDGAVVAALARVSSARERMAHFQSVTLPLVVDVERFAQTGYAAGQTPLAALLQALQQTRDTRRLGLQAGLDYQLALAELERAIGAPLR